MKIKFYLCTALILCFVGFGYAEVYTWVDEEGATHFSDKPHEGAKTLDVPSTQVFSAPAVENSDLQDKQEAKNTKSYSSLVITDPQDRVTIRNTEGFVALVAKATPNLKTNDYAQLLLDGSPLGETQKSLAFAVRGILRGSHTLAVQIISKDGKVLIASPTITIYMMPPRTNMS